MATALTLGNDLPNVLRSVDGFGPLSDQVLRELAEEMRGVSLTDGEVWIRQNDVGTTLCVVVSGVLGISWTDRSGTERTLPDIGAGRTVGEVSVLSGGPALATVRARGPVILAQLPREGFVRFSQRNPTGVLDLIEALRPQVHRHALRLALRQNVKFRDLDPQLITDLESELELLALYGGEVLVRHGETSDSIYIVISGRLRVVSPNADSEEKVLAELGPGETIGEMALITGEPRSADVYAIRDTQLAKLSKPAVERLLVRHPMAALLMLARGPVARVRDMSNGKSQVAPISTIAIVPAGPGVALAAFAEGLSKGLSLLGPTLLVTSELVDGQFGRSGAAQAFDRHGGGARLLEWLAEQEVEHRYVVYQSDAGCTPWTERAIRQADHVVIVADATGNPAPGEIESEILGRRVGARVGRTLVLLHQKGTVPSGTARWFTGRTLDRHLHVRPDLPSDFERVARLLTGHGVGLALGGGFARGLAHVGVLRAFCELNIPVDAIGGSSMGSMVGAQHLLGWDAARIVHDTSTAFSKSFDDMTIPFVAFKRGGKHNRLMKTFFGDTLIEDLWLPYFSTSANLNSADLKVHTTGSLADAVLASTRAPGVFPPVVINGELHVDGGLINNVPVDVMKTISNQGIVIGVDVSPPHELGVVPVYGDDVSGWQAIWHRFNPTREKRTYRPSILLVLMRLIEFGGISYRLRVAEQADIYISPDVLRFKRNEFQSAAGLVEAGYKAAHEALSKWLAADLEQRDRPRFGPVAQVDAGERAVSVARS